VICTLISWGFKLNLAVVGDVPSGFPAPTLPGFSLMNGQVFVTALVITILGFMESFAVADRYSRIHGNELKPNRELFALGMANTVGSFFNAYPVTGGFSRTAVNEGAGAKTKVASLVSALVVFCSLFLTQLFYYMPKSTLAAIVFVAVSSLYDWHAFKTAWKINRTDFFISVLTFVATVGLGTELGLGIGVGASLLALLYRIAFPHMAVLGNLNYIDERSGEELSIYRNLLRYPDASTRSDIILFRIDASLTFLNAEAVRRYLEKVMIDNRLEEQQYPAVIFCSDGINRVDLAGIETLLHLAAFLKERNVRFCAVEVKGPVRDMLDKVNALHASDVAKLLLPSEDQLEAAGAAKPWQTFRTSTIEQAIKIMDGQLTDLPDRQTDAMKSSICANV
jgi:SulP family sulfate permease